MIHIPEASDFSIDNLPYGIFSVGGASPRAGMALGDHIIDLARLARAVDLGVDAAHFERDTLNGFIGLGKAVTTPVRQKVQALVREADPVLDGDPGLFVPMADAEMHMPVAVGDYTDFYSSIEHATNVGVMFRDPENALLPNWRHLPVGYHGRASSIVASGTELRRPTGQTMPAGANGPVFGPSARLDFELEMAFVIGAGNALGEPITIDNAEEHIFGMVLFNDWSARDIQKWEYVPLGPFNAKNFFSSVSPWLVTLEALEPFRVEGPVQEPGVLPYLQTGGARNYDIALEVDIAPEGGKATTVCRSNFKYMYWNMAQQLAHHTAGGCNVRPGDMMASGTISGHSEDAYGSMLELAWMGTRPLELADGSKRTFINDGDTVTLRGFGQRDGVRVGFGEVSNKVLAAR